MTTPTTTVPTEPTETMDRRRDGCRSEAERSAYAEGLSDAAQRVRYLAKHQEWEDDGGGPNSRRDGFEAACEVLNELLEEASSVAALKPLAAAPVSSPHAGLRDEIAAVIDANKFEAWTVDRANQMADAILALIPVVAPSEGVEP